MTNANLTPTASLYSALEEAYAHFNRELFGGRLQPALLTLQRGKSYLGYFVGGRFGSASDEFAETDEIALNPQHFRDRTAREILSTLVHEMTHLEQHHYGKPSKRGNHNKEWGGLMKAVGLHPSSTAAPGGKETGRRVSHYIVEGGPYDVSYAALEAAGFDFGLIERMLDDGKRRRKRVKHKHQCPGCDRKATTSKFMRLRCDDCDRRMECESEEPDSGDEEDES